METQFSIKDVVWARARKPKSEIFWPAQVIETTAIPKRSTKKIIASVRFLGENTEEDVKNPKDIKKWDCKEQDSYILKGRSSLKDSNARIAFNKGIKEGRKLFKQNVTATTGITCSNTDESTEEKEPSSPKNITFVDDQAIIHCSHIEESYKDCENSQLEESCSKQKLVKAQKRRTTPRKGTAKGKTSEEALYESEKSSQKNIKKQQKKSQEPECGEISPGSSKRTDNETKTYDKIQDNADCVNNDNSNCSSEKESSRLMITRKSSHKDNYSSCTSSTKVCNDNSSNSITSNQTSQEKTTLRKSPRKVVKRTHESQSNNLEENKKSSKVRNKNSQAIEKGNAAKETKTDSSSAKCNKGSVGRKRKQEVLLSDKKQNKLSHQCDDLQNRTLNQQQSVSINNSSTSNQQTYHSTQSKRRKMLFAENVKMPPCAAACNGSKMVESSLNEQSYGKNNKQEPLPSTSLGQQDAEMSDTNLQLYGVNYHQHDSDSNESSDEELMETALSPDSKNSKFQINDIVWAKFYRGAYWPAQVKRIQKKPKKVYVKFLGATEKRCYPCQRMHSFTCDFQQREEFIKEAEKADACYFKKAFTEAEDLVRKKALGINIEPDDDDYEDVELEGNEQPTDLVVVETPPITAVEVENPEDKDVRRSKRSKKQISKYNQGMLSYIREAKPMLKDILEEKVTCERHAKFISGRTKEKSALKHQSGFGPITDHDLENDIIELLMEYHNECLPKKNNISAGLPYVLDVWLPEAIIYGIQKIDQVDRKTAEATFSQGAKSNFDHVELMQQLKSKELTDEDRQASLARAERLMEKLIQNKQNI